MKKIIELKDAKCTSVELSAPIEFLKAEPDQKGKTFKIEAYTGVVVDRWWGKLAIAVDGITAADKMPILRDHMRSQIVGYSTKSWKDGSFFVSGQFSDVTQVADEVRGLADEGFPWQASIGVTPLKILSLEGDGEAEVNGQTLKGPAEIWLESEVFETSFVPLGADGNTSVATFSKIEELAPENGNGPAGAEQQPNKGEDMKITVALLETDAPELLAQIRADAEKDGVKIGAAGELARINAVADLSMPGHEDLISTLMFDGKTSAPDAALALMAAEKKVRETALAALGTGGVAAVASATSPAVEILADQDVGHGEFDKDKALEKYKGSVELKKEFRDFESYLAYAQAFSDGNVKTLSKK